tara:strand:- start:193 stop:642 length:450 start_codon:yes stop_codon:yes gene_type:complete
MSQNIKIQVAQLTSSDNIFKDPQSLLDLIPANVVASFGGDTDALVIVGHQTPDSDSRDLPWFRFTSTGNWVGVYIFMGGDWVLAPSLPLGTIIAVADLSVDDLPVGFYFANGLSGNTYDTTGWANWDPVYAETETHYNLAYIQYVGISN